MYILQHINLKWQIRINYGYGNSFCQQKHLSVNAADQTSTFLHIYYKLLYSDIYFFVYFGKPNVTNVISIVCFCTSSQIAHIIWLLHVCVKG